MSLRRLLLASIVLAVLASAFAPPALASEVDRQGYRDSPNGPLLYDTRVRALPGETNDISIAFDPAGRVYVIEDKAGITVAPTNDPAGLGCVARTATTVACSWTHISSIVLGDGNDRLVVTSAAAPDTVRVERYRLNTPYRVSAPRGVMAWGGSGDDVMIGNAGADLLIGGNVTGSGEFVGTGNDTIDGGEGPDELAGYDGSDRVIGGGGDDYVAGGAGNDVVDAGDGEDDLEFETDYTGGPAISDGADRVLGGAGNDEILALRGRDAIDAGAGADLVFSYHRLEPRQPASTIACGAGADWVDPGRGDVVSGCEQLVVILECLRCSVTLETNVGGSPVVLATIWVPRNSEKRFVLVPLANRAVRKLLQRSPSVRVRWVQPKGGTYRFVRSHWFVLRR